jgi:hypothetical protein
MEKRQSLRVSVEPQCRARFQLGGQSYSIPVANLGTEGCGLRVPARAAGALRKRTQLEGWEFIHPGLPKGAVKAEVVWLQDPDRADGGFVASGVRFVDAPLDFSRKLYSYVITMAQPLFSDPDMMDEMPEVPE